MSIFVNETTKVVYQGLTGSAGRFYGLRNREYGTKVVAGTNPKRAGENVEGIPVFASVHDAREATGATASCIFVPAPGVESAVMEAAEAGIEFIVVITEGVPAKEVIYDFRTKGWRMDSASDQAAPDQVVRPKIFLGEDFTLPAVKSLDNGR